MFFQQLLVYLFYQLNGERSAMAPYYILRGKKSGQTLQDIHYYKVQGFFGIGVDLTKEIYQFELDKLMKAGWITSIETPSVTEVGFSQINNFKSHFQTGLLGPDCVLFEKKLQLLVQISSNALHENRSYIPIVSEEPVQRELKRFVASQAGVKQLAESTKHVVLEFIRQSTLTDNQRNLFVFRLSGFEVTGWTWSQLAELLDLRELDCLYMFRDLLVQFIAHLETTNSSLYQLVDRPLVLTETAGVTRRYLQQHLSLEEIAAVRRLKTSTIEDHYVEIASIEGGHSFTELLSREQCHRILEVQKQLQTHKLKELREELPEFSYFQIRLALAIGGASND